MLKARQKGFTLIELVVVIVILGILSAFALPRFMGLEGQARTASVRSLQGSMRSAAALAHSVYLANGTNPASINIEGNNVALAFGYPTAASIALTLSPGLTGTAGGQYTTAANSGVFTLNGSTTPASCSVTYVAPTLANRPPTISFATGGCP